jgi:hypothetical protein
MLKLSVDALWCVERDHDQQAHTQPAYELCKLNRVQAAEAAFVTVARSFSSLAGPPGG